MRKTVTALAVAALGALPAPAMAQGPDTSQLRNAVGRAEVLRRAQRLQAIGLANENNRLTASAGNLESLDFVIAKLREYGYNPSLVPYANGNAPNTWSERTPAVLEQVSPTPKTYAPGLNADVATMTWSDTADVTGRSCRSSGSRSRPSAPRTAAERGAR